MESNLQEGFIPPLLPRIRGVVTVFMWFCLSDNWKFGFDIWVWEAYTGHDRHHWRRHWFFPLPPDTQLGKTTPHLVSFPDPKPTPEWIASCFKLSSNIVYDVHCFQYIYPSLWGVVVLHIAVSHSLTPMCKITPQGLYNLLPRQLASYPGSSQARPRLLPYRGGAWVWGCRQHHCRREIWATFLDVV